ncbi:hypothetical protein SMATCC274_27070 [Serratia marcescens]|nr:hypothetical protein SMATCC274_27070 [Serratia marcescens]
MARTLARFTRNQTHSPASNATAARASDNRPFWPKPKSYMDNPIYCEIQAAILTLAAAVRTSLPKIAYQGTKRVTEQMPNAKFPPSSQ